MSTTYKRVPVYTKAQYGAPVAPVPAKSYTKQIALIVGGAFIFSGFLAAVVGMSRGTVAPTPAPVAVEAPVKAPVKAPVEAPVEAPAPAPVEAPAASPVEHTYSYDEAMTEACEAGRQYSNDVAEGFMTHSQSYSEARSYAHHLSAQSAGVDNGVLYAKIKECMW